jgi:hypothetical protein
VCSAPGGECNQRCNPLAVTATRFARAVSVTRSLTAGFKQRRRILSADLAIHGSGYGSISLQSRRELVDQ